MVFECVGVPGMIAEAADYARYGGEVMVVGFCARPDTLVPAAAIMKELTARFIGVSQGRFRHDRWPHGDG